MWKEKTCSAHKGTKLEGRSLDDNIPVPQGITSKGPSLWWHKTFPIIKSGGICEGQQCASCSTLSAEVDLRAAVIPGSWVAPRNYFPFWAPVSQLPPGRKDWLVRGAGPGLLASASVEIPVQASDRESQNRGVQPEVAILSAASFNPDLHSSSLFSAYH